MNTKVAEDVALHQMATATRGGNNLISSSMNILQNMNRSEDCLGDN